MNRVPAIASVAVKAGACRIPGATGTMEPAIDAVPARRLGWVVLLLVLLTTLATSVAAHAAADPSLSPVPVTLLTAGQTNGAAATSLPPATGLADVTFPVFRIVFALVLVLGVLFGGAWLVRRMPEMLGPRGSAPRLRVIEARSLGGKHALFVIAYDRQRLLVGSSPNGVSLIDRLPAEETLASGEGQGAPAPASFVAALSQILRSR